MKRASAFRADALVSTEMDQSLNTYGAVVGGGKTIRFNLAPPTTHVSQLIHCEFDDLIL